MPNLSLSQISTNIGNWSQDKSSYSTTMVQAQITAGNGNWSADKSNYVTNTQLSTANTSMKTYVNNQFIQNIQIGNRIELV